MQVQCEVAIGTIQHDSWKLAAASLALEAMETMRCRAVRKRWMGSSAEMGR